MSTNAGLKADGPRDYSLKGSQTARTFNAMAALAITAFAFNTGILPEMQVYNTNIPYHHAEANIDNKCSSESQNSFVFTFATKKIRYFISAST